MITIPYYAERGGDVRNEIVIRDCYIVGIKPKGGRSYNDIYREKTMSIAKTMFATLALTTIAISAPAFADKMKATLNSASEVPANTSTGTGTADIDFDPATKKLTWKLSYSGLTGPATMAHFHGPAEPGKNAGVAVPIAPATSPSEGSVTLTDAQAADLVAGKYYVNVHTEANKGGEIRGQVTK
jgi:hypothetical protein